MRLESSVGEYRMIYKRDVGFVKFRRVMDDVESSVCANGEFSGATDAV